MYRKLLTRCLVYIGTLMNGSDFERCQSLPLFPLGYFVLLFSSIQSSIYPRGFSCFVVEFLLLILCFLLVSFSLSSFPGLILEAEDNSLHFTVMLAATGKALNLLKKKKRKQNGHLYNILFPIDEYGILLHLFRTFFF